MYKTRIPKNLNIGWASDKQTQTAEEMIQWIFDNAQRELGATYDIDRYYITDKQKTLFDMIYDKQTQKIIWSKLQNNSYSDWYSSLWEPVDSVQLEMFTESEMGCDSVGDQISIMDIVYEANDWVA